MCVCAYYVGVPSGTQLGTIQTHALSDFQKHPQCTAAAQQQQQRFNTSEPRNAHIHRNACVHPLQLATTPGFQVNHIPKGILVLIVHIKISGRHYVW